MASALNRAVIGSFAPLVLVLLLGVSPGCGNSNGYDLAPVSGTVTLDGSPVPHTQITFSPIAVDGKTAPGPGSTAKCDDAGKYTLRTIRGDSGAVVGVHRVTISSRGAVAVPTGDVDVGPRPKEIFPARYNSESLLEFIVPSAGAKDADFKLESKPK